MCGWLFVSVTETGEYKIYDVILLQTAERFIRNSELMCVRDESSYVIHSFVDWCGRCEIIKYLWIYAGNVKSVCITWIDARRLKSACVLWLCVKSVFCRFMRDF